jgi:hypothetical protein
MSASVLLLYALRDINLDSKKKKKKKVDTGDISSSMPLVEDIRCPEHEQVVQEDVGTHTSMPRARPLRDLL